MCEEAETDRTPQLSSHKWEMDRQQLRGWINNSTTGCSYVQIPLRDYEGERKWSEEPFRDEKDDLNMKALVNICPERLSRPDNQSDDWWQRDKNPQNAAE